MEDVQVAPAAAWRILLLCGVLAWTACGHGDEPTRAERPVQAATTPGVVTLPPDSPKLQQIKIEAVTAAELPTNEVISPGKIELNPNRVSRIVLPVPGRVAAVMVKLGDAVVAGQPLVALESPDAEAAESAYLQSEASLTQARATLVKAQADLDRASDLYENSAVAKKDVLSAENALAQARAAVEQAQAAREQAARRVALLGLKPGSFGQKVEVRAPLAGKVLEMTVAAGEYRNDTNTPIMTIADLSTVWVAADVPESEIRFIQPGELVEIHLVAYPAEIFRGRVTRIADTVDPQTRTVKVRAEMDNARGRLRPDMFGRIRHVESVETLPLLPAGAVIQGEGHSFLFVEEAPGRFRQREVQLGNRAGDRVAVVRGLQAGERVVTDGALLLRQP